MLSVSLNWRRNTPNQPPPSPSSLSKYGRLAVLLIVLLGGALRLYGLNWDQNSHYHPDERYISMVTSDIRWPQSVNEFLDPKRSPMNPYWIARENRERAFAYGTLPVYMTRFVSYWVGVFVDKWWEGYDGVTLVGRALSGLLDTAAIYIVFLLGSRIFSRRVGLIGALFYALTVLSIQHSHFYTTDITLNFFVLLTLLFAYNTSQTGSNRDTFLMGAAAGMAFASKFSALPILAMLPVAALLHERQKITTLNPKLITLGAQFSHINWSRLIATLILAFGGFVIAYFAFAPYSFLDTNGLLRNVNEQDKIVIRAEADLPYTRQYFATTPYLYPIEQMVRWSMGVPLGVTALIGLLMCIVYAVGREPHAAGAILMLAWILPYFLITGRAYAKFLRYSLPLLPLFAIMAAALLAQLGEWLDKRYRPKAMLPTPDSPQKTTETPISVPPAILSEAAEPLEPATLNLNTEVAVDTPPPPPAPLPIHKPRRHPLQYVAPVLTALIVAATAWWALAFASIYSAPHTANQASKWINANVPKTAILLKEHWEEGINGLQGYQLPPAVPELNLYDDDGPNKLVSLQNSLTRGDYIVFFSSRLYGTIPRIPDRYPLTKRYYEMLFSGELGFELVHFSEAYPSFLGLTMFEDTFTRPDLPMPDALMAHRPTPFEINGGFADESFSAYDHPLVMVFKKTKPITPQLVAEWLGPYVLKQPWNRQLAQSNRQPLLTEAQRELNMANGSFSDIFDANSLANQVPLLAWWALLQLLSLATLPALLHIAKRLPDRGYVFARVLGWLVVGWLIWFPVSLGLLNYTRTVAVAALLLWLVIGVVIFVRTRHNTLAWLRANWRLIALEEAVFTLGFLAFVWIRMNNPDLWHPARGGEKPMDFAYLLAAIKSTTMPPYDPWFAGGFINYYYYGQYLVGVLTKITGILPEVAYNLAVPMLFAMSFAGAWSLAYNLTANLRLDNTSIVNKSAAGFGTFAALLLAVLGNVEGGMRFFKRLVFIGGSPIPEQAYATLSWGETMGRFALGVYKGITEGQKALQIPPDWFWASTRIYPGTGSIQEFPYFTFLYADLHAHMIALPVSLLVLCFALVIMARLQALKTDQSEQTTPLDSWRNKLRITVKTQLTALPIVLLAGVTLGSVWAINSWDFPIAVVIIFGAAIMGWVHSVRSGSNFIWAMLTSAAIVGWGYVAYLPFHRSFVQGYTGLETHQERSPFLAWLTVDGVFLFIIVTWLLVWLIGRLRNNQTAQTTLNQFNHMSASPELGIAAGSGVRINIKSPKWQNANRALSLLLAHPDRTRHILSLLAVFEKGSSANIAQVASSANPAQGGAVPISQSHAPSAGVSYALVMFAAGILALVLRFASGSFGPVAIIAFILAFALGIGALMQRSVSESFGMGAAAVALGLTGAVEIWALAGDIGRMNIVFKFYFQAWALMSIACAVGLAVLFKRLPDAIRPIWMGVFAVLIILAGVYPFAATYAKINDRFDTKIAPTLNGAKYMETAVYMDEAEFGTRRQQAELKLRDDWEAIQWVRSNIAGSPVMLEAVSGPPPHARLYSWGGRVAIYTGLPTILGWDHHQRQQRAGTPNIEERTRDVLSIYTAPDLPQTQQLLKQYQVSYIYYGGVEKLHYPQAEAKLANMQRNGMLIQLYDQQGVKIYKVNG